MQTLDRAAGKSEPRSYIAAILNGGSARTEDVLAETDALYRRLGVI